METTSNRKATTNYFTGALSGVGAVFQSSRIDTFNYVVPEQTSHDLEKCIGALGQTNPRDDRFALSLYSNQRSEGTCEWVLEDEVFQRWKGEAGSQQPLVWVCGPSRKGKTTLAIFISKYLEQYVLNNKDTWVLYYFCDRQRQNRNTAASILKGFLFQLHEQLPELAAILYKEFLILKDNLLQPRSIAALWRIFENMVNASPVKRIFCVVDGVDQCDHDVDSLDLLLRTLHSYFAGHNRKQTLKKADAKPEDVPGSTSQANVQPATGPELRMIIFSREAPRCIVTELDPFPRLSLPSSASHTGESDLRRHIDVKAEEVSATCSGEKEPSKETTEAVTKTLRDGEGRGFLLVSLIAERLKGMKQSQMKKYIERVPKSVEEIHIQTLLALSSRQRPQVAAILKWVALAAKPMSTLELTKAVKYDLKTSFSERALKRLLGLCHGLVQNQDNEVTLADSSVRDLLFDQHGPLPQSKELKGFCLVRSDAHSELANTCIAYLQESASLEQSRRVKLKVGDKLNSTDRAFLRKHPFLEYAIVQWTFHAKQGSLEKTNYGSPFFKSDSTRRKLWWESYWISLRKNTLLGFAWKWTAPGRFSLLHLAAFFGIVPLALYVEQKGGMQSLLAAEDHQGMKPINWATERSEASMVKFLLQRGEFDDGALRQAAQTGDVSIITMLLENRDKMLRSPRFASTPGSPTTPGSPFESLRKVTLSSISDWSKKLDQASNEKSTPLSPGVTGYGKITTETLLHIATTCGHDEAVEVFVKAGEDIHQTTDGGWTALHNASWFGRVSILNRLVAAGADAQAVTNELLTPLHCAVKNAQPDIVRCLLCEHDVDIEARDQFGLTPFHVACKSNNIAIMEMLLDYGADIEKRMRQGWTPLLWACVDGKTAVAELLLKRGADVNATWIRVGTEAEKAIELGPVGLAKAYRHEDIARLVHDFGAIDANRLTGDEANKLPPAEPLEERYTVPENPGAVTLEQTRTETGDSLDAGDLESSDESDGGSDGGSDIGSDVSDGGSRSRKQSASSISVNVKGRRQSSLALVGLGIQEEANHDVNSEAGQHGETAARGISADAVGESNAPERQDTSEPRVTQERPNGEANSESQDRSEGINCELPTTTRVEEETPETPTNDLLLADRRPSDVPKSSGVLGVRFGRFAPTKIFRATGSAVSEDRPAPFETPEGLKVDAKDDDAAGTKANDSLGELPKPDVGMLGRFRPKRFLSDKGDGNGKLTTTTSPGTEGIADPMATTTTTIIEAGAEALGLPASGDTQESTNDKSRANSTGLPTANQTSTLGRSGAKRVFSWPRPT